MQAGKNVATVPEVPGQGEADRPRRLIEVIDDRMARRIDADLDRRPSTVGKPYAFTSPTRSKTGKTSARYKVMSSARTRLAPVAAAGPDPGGTE